MKKIYELADKFQRKLAVEEDPLSEDWPLTPASWTPYSQWESELKPSEEFEEGPETVREPETVRDPKGSAAWQEDLQGLPFSEDEMSWLIEAVEYYRDEPSADTEEVQEENRKELAQLAHKLRSLLAAAKT